MDDPNLRWDGTRWLRWDGAQWVDATTGAPLTAAPPFAAPPSPTEPPPTGQSRAWLGIAIGAVAALVVIALGVALFLVFRPGDQTATPAPTPVPSSPSSPPAPSTVPTTYTLYFVNPDYPGGVYGAGVKTRGNQASGWVGTMQSGDIGCFTGTYTAGSLTGTLVIPPDGGGSAPATQPFTWPVSGAGENFRLVAIGDVTPLREVPLVTLNDYAGKTAGESWQPLFSNCAKLTGGLE